MLHLKRGRSFLRPFLELHTDKPSPVAEIDVRPAAALEGVPVRHDVVNTTFGEIVDALVLQLLLSHFPAAFRAFISARISAAVFFFGGSPVDVAPPPEPDLLLAVFLTSNGSPGPIHFLTFANVPP